MKLFVHMDVLNFDKLEEFERFAANVMKDHNGEIELAYELSRLADNSGVEIHIVQFPSQTEFDAYKADERFQQVKALRKSAISKISIRSITQSKNYID